MGSYYKDTSGTVSFPIVNSGGTTRANFKLSYSLSNGIFKITKIECPATDYHFNGTKVIDGGLRFVCGSSSKKIQFYKDIRFDSGWSMIPDRGSYSDELRKGGNTLWTSDTVDDTYFKYPNGRLSTLDTYDSKIVIYPEGKTSTGPSNFDVSTSGATLSTNTTSVTINLSSKSVLSAPTQSSILTYNGQSQSPIWDNYDTDKCIISGTTSAINAGTYTTTFTIKDAYKKDYCFLNPNDPSSIEVTWSIGKYNMNNNSIILGSDKYEYNNGDPVTILYRPSNSTILPASTISYTIDSWSEGVHEVIFSSSDTENISGNCKTIIEIYDDSVKIYVYTEEGVWRECTPYVYDNEEWKELKPHVYSNSWR